MFTLDDHCNDDLMITSNDDIVKLAYFLFSFFKEGIIQGSFTDTNKLLLIFSRSYVQP